MKLFFDLLPIILFFGSFKFAEQHSAWANEMLAAIGVDQVPATQSAILLATLVVILATIAQIGWVHFRQGKVDKLLWVSLVLVVSLGSLTLILRDENFIKWKPTILYLVMGVGLLLAEWAGKRPLQGMLGDKLTLPATVWRKLSWVWAIFFGLLATINLFVAYHYSTDTWVNFKLFGLTGLLFAFILAQGLFLSNYLEPTEHDQGSS